MLRSSVRVPILVWLLLAACAAWSGHNFLATGATIDPDAIMRMIEVRDLLGGQRWFDLTQYRFGPGATDGSGGVAMHWSRVADLLPAGLTLVLTPFVRQTCALFLAQAATPLLLLLPVSLLAVAVARALVPVAGKRSAVDIPLAFVLVTSLATLSLFIPGNVDHHNLQLIAVLLLLAAACASPTTRMGVLAGVAVTLAMTIGVETAPHVVAVLGAVALRWVFDPARERGFIRGLGIGQVASALVSLVVFMPRPWASGQCDAWTPAVFWLVSGAGGLFVLAASRDWSGRVARIAVLAIGGAVIVGAVAAAYPACLRHPAGTDPLLWRYWMDGITENEPVTGMAARGEWHRVVLNLGSAPVVLALGTWVALSSARIGKDVRAWWPVLAAGFAALAITLIHVRGQAMLWGVAAPLAAALIGRARASGGWRMVAGWTLLPPLGAMLLATVMTPDEIETEPSSAEQQAACYAPPVIAALDRLPPSTLVVPITVEPMILARTHHRSLGATYHRNTRGNHLMIAAMVGTPDAARPLLIEGGARYLLFCPAFDMSGSYAHGNPESLAAALSADRAPEWLAPLGRFAGDVRLYRIE